MKFSDLIRAKDVTGMDEKHNNQGEEQEDIMPEAEVNRSPWTFMELLVLYAFVTLFSLVIACIFNQMNLIEDGDVFPAIFVFQTLFGLFHILRIVNSRT